MPSTQDETLCIVIDFAFTSCMVLAWPLNILSGASVANAALTIQKPQQCETEVLTAYTSIVRKMTVIDQPSDLISQTKESPPPPDASSAESQPDDWAMDVTTVRPELLPVELKAGLMALQQEVDKTVKTHEYETTDEVTVQTSVTQVKTIKMEISEWGGVSLLETTETKTDTDMTEMRKTKEKDETLMTHKVMDKRVPEIPAELTLPRSPIPPMSPLCLKAESERESDHEAPSMVSEPIPVEEISPIYVAISAYEPESDEVLSLHEGEKVEVLDDTQDDWWLVRKTFDNREGWAPGQYLKERDEYTHMVEQNLAKAIEKLPSESRKISVLYDICDNVIHFKIMVFHTLTA